MLALTQLVTQSWLLFCDIKLLHWPAYSSDWNLIGNSWGLLIRHAYQHGSVRSMIHGNGNKLYCVTNLLRRCIQAIKDMGKRTSSYHQLSAKPHWLSSEWFQVLDKLKLLAETWSIPRDTCVVRDKTTGTNLECSSECSHRVCSRQLLATSTPISTRNRAAGEWLEWWSFPCGIAKKRHCFLFIFGFISETMCA